MEFRIPVKHLYHGLRLVALSNASPRTPPPPQKKTHTQIVRYILPHTPVDRAAHLDPLTYSPAVLDSLKNNVYTSPATHSLGSLRRKRQRGRVPCHRPSEWGEGTALRRIWAECGSVFFFFSQKTQSGARQTWNEIQH